MNSKKVYLFLIPGFFGFDEVGGISYFHHVKAYLEEYFAGQGYEAIVTSVSTHPTASLSRRSVCVLETIDSVVDEDAPIHLIGHSTGGLDARLLTCPGAQFQTDLNVKDYLQNIQTVTSIASPNHGTPLAHFFNSLSGKNLLYAITLMTIYSRRFGQLPLSVIFYLSGYLMKLDRYVGVFRDTMINQIRDRIPSDFDELKQKEIDEFLAKIRSDQSGVIQLTPAGAEIINLLIHERPETRYGCVPVIAPRQGWETFETVGWHPYRKTMNAIFQLFYRIVRRQSTDLPIDEELFEELNQKTDLDIDKADNDGIVPVFSQLHGSILHIASGDHLDVCGHFQDADHDPPHYDWLASGADFDRSDYEQLWAAVADFILDEQTYS